MADYRRAAPDRDYGDIPDREVIRDDVEKDEEPLDENEDFDEDEDDEEDDADLGKSVLDQEHSAAPIRGFTAEVGNEGGGYGDLELKRERRRRRANAGEATTGGETADTLRFGHRRDEREE